MGYFSQRKKRERENLFMAVSLILLSAIYVFLLFDGRPGGFVETLRGMAFHLYLFSILLLCFALWRGKILYSVLALLLLLWGYASIAKTAQIFFSDSSSSLRGFDVAYKPGEQDYDNPRGQSGIKILREGVVRLSPTASASFYSFDKAGQAFTLITFDFSKVKPKELPLTYENLAKFILGIDEPIVVAGDFAVSAWSPLMRDFLIKTGLNVKNRILLSEGHKTINFFNVPTVNLLGFDNIAIRKIEFSPKDGSFLFKLAY